MYKTAGRKDTKPNNLMKGDVFLQYQIIQLEENLINLHFALAAGFIKMLGLEVSLWLFMLVTQSIPLFTESGNMYNFRVYRHYSAKRRYMTFS